MKLLEGRPIHDESCLSNPLDCVKLLEGAPWIMKSLEGGSIDDESYLWGPLDSETKGRDPIYNESC